MNDLISFNVEISEFRNSDGKVIIYLYNSKEEIIKHITADVNDSFCRFTIKNIPRGKYAIKYFQDENEDNQWGKNFIGMPNEGFGYSNNAKKKFSEPDFNDWLFELDESINLNLKITYLL